MSFEVEVGRFFTVPLKKTQDVDLVKPLETFIKNTYDKTDENLGSNVREFNTMRKNATKQLDKSVNSLNVLFSYHDQLVAVFQKVPFKEGAGVHVPFVWKDSLQKGKFLSGTPKLSIADGSFERLCILYNIAALMSQIGNEANLQTDDGLKNAAKYFQESAGIFGYIKENILSVAGDSNLTTDITPEVLSAFKSIMVAQAQECFYDKASSDPSLNQKPGMIAKIANQCAYLYGETVNDFNTVENNYSLSQVIQLCRAKQDLFGCRAQMYQARAATEDKRFGESIARYRLLDPTLKSLVKSSSELFGNINLKQLYAIVSSEKESVEKDNNFIYNDVIPKNSDLVAIGKAAIAKAKGFNATDNLSPKFQDLFRVLVPLSVHNALEAYEARRKELVDKETERLREQTTLINSVMSSLNLPAALEDVSGKQIPNSILEKSKVVISKGGTRPIDQLLQDLPDSLSRNQDILSECVRILNEEQASDAELREKFGAKWTRKPSAELTAPLRQESIKYQTIIENAQKADGIIRTKYAENKEGMDLLCLPENQLKTAVPSGSPVAALKNHEVVKELKMLCEKVDTMKAEREVIENELKTVSNDMTAKFVSVLAEEGALLEENISPGELDRIYQPLITQVTESIGKQESIQANLQRASEQFTSLKQQGGGVNNREEVLKKMAAAFDTYNELSANLNEGNRFYGDLTQLLLKLQGKCSDLVFARKTEKEELLKDLQQNIVSSSSSTTPTPVPSYHNPQEDIYAQVKKPAPARPPPPAAAPAQAPPTEVPQQPKPAPRRGTGPAAASAASAPPPTAPTTTQAPPGHPPQTQQQQPGYAHQQPPYSYPQGGAPSAPGTAPPGYSPYPPQQQQPYGAPPQAPYPQQGGYPAYPPQPGYAPQGFAAYPQQQPYPGYQPQPPQGYPNAQYGSQPPYYYPPQ